MAASGSDAGRSFRFETLQRELAEGDDDFGLDDFDLAAECYGRHASSSSGSGLRFSATAFHDCGRCKDVVAGEASFALMMSVRSWPARPTTAAFQILIAAGPPRRMNIRSAFGLPTP